MTYPPSPGMLYTAGPAGVAATGAGGVGVTPRYETNMQEKSRECRSSFVAMTAATLASAGTPAATQGWRAIKDELHRLQ